MKKILDYMQRGLSPVAIAMSNNKYFIALRDGMAPALPIIVFGSFLMLIPNLPITESIIGADAVAGFKNFAGQSSDIAMNITAMICAFSVAYYFAKREKVDPLMAGWASLASFLMIIPLNILEDGSKAIALSNVGTTGLFLGMMIGLLVGKSYSVMMQKGWTIKLPDTVPEAVSKSLGALIAVIAMLCIATIIRIGFMLTSFGNAMDFIYKLMQMPMMDFGGTIASCVVVAGLNQFIWFFGLHPGAITNMYYPVLMALSQTNFDAIAAGGAATNVINYQFYVAFFEAAGVNSVCLAIVLTFVCKRKENREIGKLGFPAAIFNVIEPIVFGLPTVLNPYLMLPNILAPLATILLGYIATITHFVPIAVNHVHWTTPTILSGFLTTGSITGSIVQIVGIALGVLIYWPFVKVWEMNQAKLDEANAQAALEEASTN